MKVNYNIQKEERKAMVGIIGKVLGEKPVYCGAPTFSYKIGAFEIMKDGSLCFDDATDEATVARVRMALSEDGFMSEDWENEASCADTGANEPIQTEAAADDEPTPAETVVEEPAPMEAVMEEPDEAAKAYAEFISKLCLMARAQKRVTAKEKIVDNEKYAFRCFLLRLGMIGSAYKQSRKILLQNLIGSSAFKSGHRKEAEDHAVSE